MVPGRLPTTRAEAGKESPCDVLFQIGRLRLGEAGSLAPTRASEAVPLILEFFTGSCGATAPGMRALVSSGVQGAGPPC